MKYLLLFIAFCVFGCSEKRKQIQNSEYDNFSDLHHIYHPSIKVFENYTSFPIKITTGDVLDHNSILYLTESANVIPIKKENLEILLSKEEFKDFITNYCDTIADSVIYKKEYYGYARIIKPNYILLEVRIEEHGDWGRHNVFELRTHKADGELISKVEFAKWSDRDNEYYSGLLSENMKIEVSNEDSAIARYFINDHGLIQNR